MSQGAEQPREPDRHLEIAGFIAVLPQGSGCHALRSQLAKAARDPPAPALLWHHPVYHSRGSISTDGPRGGHILLAPPGLGQFPRVRNPPGSPVPPPTPVAHHPVNKRRFPGASRGCGKPKFPAMRHLPTPSVEVFRLVAAPRVGRGALLSHTLLGQPCRDPHTAPGCRPGPLVCPGTRRQQPKGRSPAPSRCCRAGGRAAPSWGEAPRCRGGDLRTARSPAPLPGWAAGAASCSQGASLPARRLLFGQNRTDHMARLAPAP